MKKTAIVCIGDELLDGRTADQNAAHLIARSQELAMSVVEVRIVADELGAITAALSDLKEADRVVVSGGLGPTVDDITRHAAAHLIGAPLVEDSEALARLQERFASRGRAFTDNLRRQAKFPEGATILINHKGTADGFSLRHGSTDYFFFPGVPREFRWYVGEHFRPAPSYGVDTAQMLFFGLGESALEDHLGELVETAQAEGLKVGFRATFPFIEVVLGGAAEVVAARLPAFRERLSPWLVGEQGQSLIERLAALLVDRGETVTVAESCTAGLLAAELTDLPGSSRYFQRGYITYANEAKIELLGVRTDDLDRHGAVSRPVVIAMARGAKSRSGATYALAISGIAGPSGGSSQKPVGTVDFALDTPRGTFYQRRCFPRQWGRRSIRTISVQMALSLLLRYLEDKLDDQIEGPLLEG